MSRRGAAGALIPVGAGLVTIGLVVTLVAWPRGGSSSAIPDIAGGFQARVASGSRDRQIAALQGHLRARSKDWRGWAQLGALYVEQARVTADPTYYAKSDGALHRSLDLERGGNAAALAGLGMLANARHDFSGGLSWAEQARAVDPVNAGVRGVLADALLELGRYDEGFAAVQGMVDLLPGLPSYARVAYARELQGDVAGAAAALEEAGRSAGDKSDGAFASFQLGELRWSTGDLAGADAAYTRAAGLDPSYVPARAARARLHAAAGDVDRAIEEYKQVVAEVPAPQYVIELGDLATVTGHPDLAAAQARLLEVEERLFVANGVNLDVEIATYSADHGVDLARGLGAARAEYGRRRSVVVADALAWQLHANGRDAEALPLANEALRLGTRNALFLFHRGMIHRALDHPDAARRDLEQALALNPHFSLLLAPRARDALASLPRSG